MLRRLIWSTKSLAHWAWKLWTFFDLPRSQEVSQKMERPRPRIDWASRHQAADALFKVHPAWRTGRGVAQVRLTPRSAGGRATR
jgi:hypothetical protein